MDRAVTGSDEPALLERLRLGEDAAFGELFEQHAAAVRRLARGLASDSSEAEDITAETFFRVLQAVRRGNGPRDNVRAYLLTVARRVSWEWHGARRDVPVTDDELTHRAGAGADSQSRTAETTLITRAFTSLPERWRTVLWQTEVEGLQPAHAARDFGLSANATAALARRARLGLRAAYLQAHLAVDRSSDGCRTVMEKLGGYTAGSVTGAEASKIKAHLGTCSSCRTTHDELQDVCSSLRAHAGVIVLFVPAAGLAASVTTGVGTVGGAGGTAGSVAAAATGGTAGSVAAVGGAGGTAVAVGKVGLALASTAFVGVVGIVGPADPGISDSIGLPSNGDNAQLHIAEPTGGPMQASSSLVPGKGVANKDYLEQRRGAGAQPRDGEPTGAEQQATEYSAPRGLEIASEATKGQTPAEGTQLPGQSAAGKDKATSNGKGKGKSNGKARIDPGETEVDATTMKSNDSKGSSGKPPKSKNSHPAGKPSSPPGKPTSKPGKSSPSSAEPSQSATPTHAERTSPGDSDRCEHGPPSWAPSRAHDGDECASNGATGFPRG